MDSSQEKKTTKDRAIVLPLVVECTYKPLGRAHWLSLLIFALISGLGLAFLLGKERPVVLEVASPTSLILGSTDSSTHIGTLIRNFPEKIRSSDYVLLGSSLAVVSVWSDEEINDRLAKTVPGKRLVNLSGIGFGVIDMFFTLESAPLREGQTLLIMLSLDHLTQNVDFHNFRAKRISESAYLLDPGKFVEDYGHIFPGLTYEHPLLRSYRQSRNLIYRYVHASIGQWFSRVFRGEDIHLFTKLPRQRNIAASFRVTDVDSKLKNIEDNSKLILKLIHLARAKKLQVLFLDPPNDAFENPQRQKLRLKFNEVIEQISRETNVRRVNLSPSAALIEADYFDIDHLNFKGANKWAEALVSWLAQERPGPQLH